jgi:hypothetical protein
MLFDRMLVRVVVILYAPTGISKAPGREAGGGGEAQVDSRVSGPDERNAKRERPTASEVGRVRAFYTDFCGPN